MLLRRLVSAFLDDVRATNFRGASARFMRSLRALRFPAQSNRVLKLLDERRADLRLSERDLFFHLHHHHYLSRGFTPQQRIESLLAHYQFEATRYLPSFRGQVYGGQGLVLWQSTLNGTDFRIRLIPGNEVRWRWEGELSAVLSVNGVTLTVMSFSYVNASVFGLSPGPILFITRNQSFREAEPQLLFRSTFKQTTPPYFCLAALSGLAHTNGMRGMAAIRHDAHISQDRDNEEHLKNSYTEFWNSFHATELGGPALLLPVPMAMRPLSDVPAKHRTRARVRREAWAQVTASASAAIRRHQSERTQLSHYLSGVYMLLVPLLGV